MNSKDVDDLEDRIREIEEKIERLEHKSSENGSGIGCLPLFAPFGLGSALAIVLSWQQNHSIPWATFHGILNWGYVVYYWWTTR